MSWTSVGFKRNETWNPRNLAQKLLSSKDCKCFSPNSICPMYESAIPATLEPAIPTSSEPTLVINNENDLGHYLVDDFDVTAIFRRYQIHSDKIAKLLCLKATSKNY